MRIAVDLTHPCDVNFFRASIQRWRSDGHEVRLFCLDRKPVPRLVRHEYPEVDAQLVGRHAESKWGLYLETGLKRELQLLAASLGQGLDVLVGFPGFQTAIIARLIGARGIGAYDDPEHKPNMRLARALCHKLIVPECLGITGRNIVTCRCLKEWAYLAPAHFRPDPEAPRRLGLEPRSYVFLREIEERSLNYQSKGPSIVEQLYRSGLSEQPTVLSLENKQRRYLYPGWHVLEEPVEDIHSLMYFSRWLGSSGDSVAREGAQLGVPSVYMGSRSMKANELLLSMRLMDHAPDLPAAWDFANRANQSGAEQQEQARARLAEVWEDPSDLLTRVVYGT